MGRFGEIDLAQKSLPWERGLYGTTLPSPTDPNEWVAITPALEELAAVVMALQGTPRADDLTILIDSAAAIQRLRWFRSHTDEATRISRSVSARYVHGQLLLRDRGRTH